MKKSMIRITCTLLTLGAIQSWAQTSTATGTFLGQKVPPVLGVELDAATNRNSPQTSGPATGPAGTGIDKDRERNNAASVPTYTGLQNSESMGNAVPQTLNKPIQIGR